MKLTDDDLRALYRERAAREARDVAACPGAEELVAASLGELDAAARERVADHVATCAACADEYRLLGELRPRISRAAGAGAPRTSAWRTVAMAATIVLVAATALVAWRASRPSADPRPVDRSGQTSALRTEPPNRARLAAPPATLSWDAAEAGATYRVVLYDFESTPMWESPSLASPPAVLPDDVRDRLPRGKPVYWRVVVRSGVDQRELGPFQFVVE